MIMLSKPQPSGVPLDSDGDGLSDSVEEMESFFCRFRLCKAAKPRQDWEPLDGVPLDELEGLRLAKSLFEALKEAEVSVANLVERYSLLKVGRWYEARREWGGVTELLIKLILAVEVLLILPPDPGEGGGRADVDVEGDGGGDVLGGVGGGGPTSSCPEIRLGRLLSLKKNIEISAGLIFRFITHTFQKIYGQFWQKRQRVVVFPPKACLFLQVPLHLVTPYHLLPPPLLLLHLHLLWL